MPVRAVCAITALGLSIGGCQLKASTTPLGGSRDVVPEPAKGATSAAPTSAVVAALAPAEQEAVEQAEVTPVTPSAAETATEPTKALAPAVFRLSPYTAHQAWTRSFDLEFALKVGPGGNIDMKMVSHQEARFEVLAVTNGAVDKLQIEYTIYTSKMTIMGAAADSPEELAGKRFVVTFAQGKPEVRDGSGGKPPQKQIDSVEDDAREPLEMEKALKELSQLTAKGQGDFSGAGAVALAGGEDHDTKVSRASARLQKLTTGNHNDKLALVDLGYTLTNAVDDKTTIEVQVKGNLSVLDAPARYQTSTLQGPMEIRSSEPSGMQGRGTVKIVTSYKY
jgi:hypothetical protein